MLKALDRLLSSAGLQAQSFTSRSIFFRMMFGKLDFESQIMAGV